jgi:hypothetical protein
MKRRNVVPKLSLLLVVAAFPFTIFIVGPASLAHDGAPGDHVDLLAVMIQLVIPMLFLPAWLVGICRAYKSSDYQWLISQVILFPSAYIYTLFVNRGYSANNSFNPKPLRGSG